MRAGKYELLSEIGRGGMGVVYRGRSPEGRAVAVKVLTVTDRSAVAAFDRETRLLWSLTQADGFVPVLDAGDEAGRRWLVMPLVEGGTLRDRMKKGPIPPVEAVALVKKLAEALGRAHERGIVHRDVKPGNVIFTREGEPLVADLGLAKHFRRDVLGASQSAAISGTGMIKGTPGYMPPEQIEATRVLGPAADVFALGVVLHECLAGERPFAGDSVVSYLQQLERGPRPLPESVPGWLRPVVARALATEPGARFRDGRELARALAAPGPPPRRRLGIGVGVFAIIIAVALAAVLGRPPHREDEPPRPDEESASALADASLEARRAHDLDKAIALATKAIERAPKLAKAWCYRGEARENKGDLQGAIADETRAIELDPTSERAWADRGGARERAGDLDGALADETRAIELDPHHAWAWGVRGVIKGKKGDHEGEIADETRAIELDPKNPSVWNNRGIARGEKGDLAGEIEDETRAIELDPGRADAWKNRAGARGRLGDVEGGRADLERFLDLAPDDPEAKMLREKLHHPDR